MKKHVLNFILILFNVFAFAQNGPPWKPEGNNASTGDFLGTTNNVDLLFKTNNTTRFTLNSNGDIIFNSLANSFNSSFLSIDQSGKVNSIDQNSLGLFQRNGNDYYITNGNLGLGISPSPGIRLDVIGDARISNNLYVGGGIIITDKVQAATQIKGFDFKVDHDLLVDGNSKFIGNLTAEKGILFDATNNLGVGFTPATGTTSAIFRFGYSSSLAPLATCITPNINTANPSFIFNGHISATANNGLVNSVLNVLSAPWNGSGYVEVEGTDELGGTNNALFINYFCGRNTAINMGNGGKVSVGNNFEVGFANQDLNITANINAVGGTKIAIGAFSQHAVDGGWNTKIVVNRDGTKAIGVINGATGVEAFKVYGNGKTEIGHITQKTGPYANAMLTVNGITASKEIVVTQQNWADYVFAKDYSLPSWKETENYFKTNSHLKDVPTAKEILENGNNLGETSVVFLKKLEEAYLYIGGLHSDIEDLKKEIQELKKSNDLLLKKK